MEFQRRYALLPKFSDSMYDGVDNTGCILPMVIGWFRSAQNIAEAYLLMTLTPIYDAIPAKVNALSDGRGAESGEWPFLSH